MVRGALAWLLVPAAAVRKQTETASTAPVGYTELNGKCTGRWIELWSDGRYAHYGEDHRIDGIEDCADVCDQHPECAGFYTKDGKCSHWRSGQLSANPRAGHTCYVKEGGAAPAPPPHHVSESCDPVQGFNVQAGKCTGRWIEVWGDGHFAHYGEDHHISGVADCASTCSDHNECSGFYTKNGRCSHWRSGSLSVRPNAGHCCYSKDRSSLAQIEEQLDADIEHEDLEFANYTADVEDEEDIDAETGLPGCCWRNCCRGRPNRRDRCWCNGSMCRARRHHGGFCWNRYHYHHRAYHGPPHGGYHGGGYNNGGNIHVHFR